MANLEELDVVALVDDLPAEKLTVGTTGTVVHAYGDGKTFEVEFMTPDGVTIAVTTVQQAQLRLLTNRELARL